MSQIREDFNGAFKDNHQTEFPPHIDIIAKGWMLIGAVWMAERCAEIADKRGPVIGGFSLISSSELRQLAKSLEE